MGGGENLTFFERLEGTLCGAGHFFDEIIFSINVVHLLLW